MASWGRLGDVLESLEGILEASWRRLGGVLEASWVVLEASWRVLEAGVLEAMLSRHRSKKAQDAKTFKKNQGKPVFFGLPRARLGGVLDALGRILEALGGVLEASWVVLEVSWKLLEASWRPC